MSGRVARVIDGMAGRLRRSESELERLHQVVNGLLVELREHDATEQSMRQAELRNDLAIQGGNLSLWELVVGEGRWMLDRGWFAYLGVTLDPSISDAEAWRAIVDPADMPDLLRRVGEVVAGEQGSLESTFRVHRDDGGVLWVMARGNAVDRADDGHVLSIAGSMLDVTRWHELEEQLRQSQKMESIGQLAAGIAHEINTPIQFIGDNTRFSEQAFAAMIALLGAYRTAMESHPDPAVRQLAAAAEEAADLAFLQDEVPRSVGQTMQGVERVATIVRAMKEFSHPTGSEPVPSDINHLIDNLIVISGNAWRYVANLEFTPDRSLPPVLLASGDFNQAVLNIIVNAAQAIEAAQASGVSQPGMIAITTRRDGESAELRIADNGCGMSAEVRERIYDPFFTTRDVGSGSGQGLTIARSVIVDRHRGAITCESEPGRGTTFTIRLPLAASARTPGK